MVEKQEEKVQLLLDRQKKLERDIEQLDEVRKKQEQFEEEVTESMGEVMYYLRETLDFASSPTDSKETNELIDDVRISLSKFQGEMDEQRSFLKQEENRLLSDLDETRVACIREEIRLEEDSRKEISNG
ncbi:hypothetical protein ODU07_02540 [Streptococcus suis]|nr:hypothetical protein [Streptococcus suis]NQI89660.1 hypothetical protein [Streptococcus suis]NQI92198.1 hypothetical protein [Streptococcus suis]NQJ02232.1 hypothetical protein [Streptococcus suis]HEM6206211.1 hypothetical protein [Streptococcus suis]